MKTSDELDTSRHASPSGAPTPWRLPTRAIAWRLFLTCWIVYALHFATNIAREIYPALALGDHFSVRLDEYAHLHPDIFEKEGYGWHIANNPGVSMVAAVPYALTRPLIDRIAERVQRDRQGTEPPAYDSPWPMAREMYAEAWRRGIDVKLGLAAFVMQALAMAPSSALGVVALFYLLRRLLASDRDALWMALLYAFGTPVFFRTGFLNHNLMLGHLAFFGMVAVWAPSGEGRWSSRRRAAFAGLMGGAALLFDYSGAIFLLALFVYVILKSLRSVRPGAALVHAASYVAGTVPAVALLWLYQWRSFGHPFYPAQHWMGAVQWVDRGYQGYSPPQLDLLLALAFDYRFGLFVSCPILILGIVWALRRRGGGGLPKLETALLLGTFAALWIFFSGVNFTRLQFNTGVRYLTPILPFLFIPTAFALRRLQPLLLYLLATLSVTLSWCLAMVREVETGPGILNPVVTVFTQGFQLPALTTLSRLGEFAHRLPNGASPLPLFALVGALLWVIWVVRSPRSG